MTERAFAPAPVMPLDRPWQRLPWLIPSALLLWTAMLAVFVHILSEKVAPPPLVPIEVGLLGGGGGGMGGSIGGGGPAAGITPSAPPAPAAPKSNAVETPHSEVKPPPAPPAKSVVNEPPKPVVKEPPPKSLAKPKPEPETKPVRRAVAHAKKVKPQLAPVHKVVKTTTTPPPARKVVKAATPPAPNAPSKPSNAPAPTGLAAKTGTTSTTSGGAGSPGGGGAGSGTGGAVGSASGGAQAIYAPMPTIPDDLRADVFHAEAVARFEIMPDGTAHVALVRPTPNPRLNYLLLEALKQWRFFPAVKEGKAVASVVEIRIPIAIE